MNWAVLRYRTVLARDVAIIHCGEFRFKFLASAWSRLLTWWHQDDTIVLRSERAMQVISDYRNWMGVNRVERA